MCVSVKWEGCFLNGISTINCSSGFWKDKVLSEIAWVKISFLCLSSCVNLAGSLNSLILNFLIYVK